MSDELKHGNITSIIYASMLGQLQSVFGTHGYALAIHGSMARDFDLVAIPWIERPSTPDELVAAIVAAFRLHEGNAHGPEIKPHGRLAWTIPVACGLAIDLSVLPTIDAD